MRHTELETKIWLTETGKSRIFENWHKFTGVSKDEFIEALKWLDADPGEKYDNGVFLITTRFIGCKEDGTLVRGKRIPLDIGGTAIYRMHDDLPFMTLLDFPKVCISKDDRI